MIIIDDKLISDDVVQSQFVCDLTKCKGGCCEDGDAGAPLELEELAELNANYEVIRPYMIAEGKREIEKQGKYIYDDEFGWVTPTIKGGMCAYGLKDERGIIKCAIEQAYNDGKLSWKKPISCHMFPIRTKKSSDGQHEYLNYEPREDLCSAACKFGKKLKVPTYVFLKDALIRKYGLEFYETLEATAKHMESEPATKRKKAFL